MVVQATLKDKGLQICLDVKLKLIQRVSSLSQLNVTKKLYGIWTRPRVGKSLSLLREVCRVTKVVAGQQ